MKTFIVKVENEEVRERLEAVSSKVGKPRVWKKMLLVDTNLTAEEIGRIPGVLAVEADQETDIPDAINPLDIEIQHGPKNWFLKALSNNVHYRYNRTGDGVDIYILDSGVRTDHEEFEGRVETLWSFDEKAWDHETPASPDHGTMCAGCAAGKVFGVAKKATIINMRYNWRNAEAIKAIDLMLDHHKNKSGTRGSVFSTSFSTKSSIAYREAAKEVAAAGIVWVSSAGNENSEGARYPAGNKRVVGVGCLGSYRGDWMNLVPATYSNYGEGVDIWAPGDRGIVAGTSNPKGTQFANGTSAACPVTAGLVAMILEGSGKLTSEEEVQQVHQVLYAHCDDRAHLEGKYANSINRVPRSLFENPLIKPYPVLEPVPKPEPGPEPKPEPPTQTSPVKESTPWYKKKGILMGGFMALCLAVGYFFGG